jgi:hypothetical protein
VAYNPTFPIGEDGRITIPERTVLGETRSRARIGSVRATDSSLRQPEDDTEVMQKGERSRFVAVIGLVVALMSTGFALAGDPFTTPDDEPTACEPIDDTLEDGDTSGEGEQAESEEGDESEECEDAADEADGSDEAEAPKDDEGTATDEAAAFEPIEERVKECTEAAGMTPADAPDEKPVPGEKKGLENAISHVLWNCIRNDNDGQVNALEHLSANLERKEARDEAKEERKAERDEAKAERKAAHQTAKLAKAAARSS